MRGVGVKSLNILYPRGALCVNTHGFPGANIPCDLHMEHINSRLKIMLHNLGSIFPQRLLKKQASQLQQCSTYIKPLSVKLPHVFTLITILHVISERTLTRFCVKLSMRMYSCQLEKESSQY